MTIRYLDLLGVANRIGVSHGTARKYRLRLPAPDAMIGDRAGWTPATIDQWQANRPGKGGRPQGGNTP